VVDQADGEIVVQRLSGKFLVHKVDKSLGKYVAVLRRPQVYAHLFQSVSVPWQKKIGVTRLFTDLLLILGVGLIGPKQVGKTTLVKQWAKQAGHPAVYPDLESSKDRSRLTDPHLFLSGIIWLFMNELRGMIDDDRRPGRKK
jgi:hypothetical protein